MISHPFNGTQTAWIPAETDWRIISNMTAPLRIWSVGHSNHPLEEFINLLTKAEIETVVDVRSQPYSRYTPHFNGPALASSLAEAQIGYVFMGDSLGGRPPEPSMYDEEGHVLYSEMATSERLLNGVNTLLDLASRGSVAMMCSEESPLACHRRLLISRVLDEGVEVIHLRAKGEMISEVAFTAEIEAKNPPTLFQDEEVKVWRSILPVLQNTERGSFSEH